MALGFGRKKSAPEAQDTPAPSAAPPSSPAPAAAGGTVSSAPVEEDDVNKFDLDAFAHQLEAGVPSGQTSPFDDMFTSPGATPSGGSPSAYDFPDLDDDIEPMTPSATSPEPLDLNAMFESEQRDAIAAGKIPPPNALIPLPTNLAEVAAEPMGLFEPQVEKPKKKLPLVPIVGAVLALGLLGGGALFLTHSGGSDDTETAAPALPPKPHKPAAAPPNAAPPADAAPPANAAAPAKPASPAVPPAAAPDTATVPMTPQLAGQLKDLWKQGADAKHKGDNKGAREAWEKALKLRPGHPGFADAIAQLPK